MPALAAISSIDTCEIAPKHAEVAQRYFDCCPFGERIKLHLGPALETIDRLDGEFDFVFIDANKDGYVDYYEAVLPRLARRGLIAVDNTLSAAACSKATARSRGSTSTSAATRAWCA